MILLSYDSINKVYPTDNAISMELVVLGTKLDMTEKPKYLLSRSGELNCLNQVHRNKHRKMHAPTVNRREAYWQYI